jgi:hypothetical protein
MPADVYTLFVKHLSVQDPSVRRQDKLPHPPGAHVALPFAMAKTHIEHGGRTFAPYTAHPGNSAIVFRSPGGGRSSGFIDTMWVHKHNGVIGQYLVVQPHGQFSPADQAKDLYHQHPKLHAQIVYDAWPQSAVLIAPSDIISHTAYRVRPPGTFGIPKGTIVVVNLNCGRSMLIA